MAPTIVIVGASVGGIRTAQALRREGYGGRLVVLSEEDHAPYDRPPLSKQYLRGEWDRSRLTLLDESAPDAWGIDVRLGAQAVDLNLDRRIVSLADGSEVGFDQVVIATGARPREVPWQAGARTYSLRTLADCEALRAALAHDGDVVIVGGGFIGAEVASAASAMGRSVSIVDPLELPAAAAVGSEVGSVLASVHTRHGVQAAFGTAVDTISEDGDSLMIGLSDKRNIRAGTVVVGIGVLPNTEWLAASGLELKDGIACDASCRAIGHPDVYAVGDVASWYSERHGRLRRVEHWTNAVGQAACVAHNLAHPDEPSSYTPTDYVWSDQYDWKIQICGWPAERELLELIGDTAGQHPHFLALYGELGGTLGGAVAVNWPRALITARRLIDVTTPFDSALKELRKLPVANQVPSGV